MKEQEQYLGLLGQLKDYDEVLTQELAAKAYQEQERQRLEASFSVTSITYSIISLLLLLSEYLCIMKFLIL